MTTIPPTDEDAAFADIDTPAEYRAFLDSFIPEAEVKTAGNSNVRAGVLVV